MAAKKKSTIKSKLQRSGLPAKTAEKFARRAAGKASHKR